MPPPPEPPRSCELALKTIRSIFKLRTCTLNLAPESIAADMYQPCLEYHIMKRVEANARLFLDEWKVQQMKRGEERIPYAVKALQDDLRLPRLPCRRLRVA